MLIPFKKEHLEVMDIRAHERDILGLNANIGDILEQSTESHTATKGGKVIACWGVCKNIYGAGEVWLIPSIYITDYRVEFIKVTLKWLEDTRIKYNLHRLQTVSVDDESHTNYMQFLGFEKEGVMKSYALGENYCMWGKTWA